MRLLVCGDRKWEDRAYLFGVLDGIHASQDVSILIEGEAHGADTMAAQWARSHRIGVLPFTADWAQHGRAAGAGSSPGRRLTAQPCRPLVVEMSPNTEERNPMNDNLLMIAVTEAKGAVERAVADTPTMTIEDRLRAAFKVTRHHWLATDEETQFRAGIGGVLLTASEDEKARITAELTTLRTLGAAMSGVPVNLDGIGAEDAPKPIGMIGIWRDDRGAEHG